MSQQIKVKLKKKVDNSYSIFIGQNMDNQLINFIKKNFPESKVCLISDNKVAKLFGEKLSKKLSRNKISNSLISFPAGEKRKNLTTVERLSSKMVKEKFNRKDIVLALGGGVTGDLAGFIASIFMRGIPVIQVPTSLLAMVDSSVGGKTGVDLEDGKNLVGAFHQPQTVIIDVNYLKNLPKREFNSGMAEIIKHAIIRDRSFFKWIEQNREKIKKLDTSTLQALISKSCLIKKKIVEKDEKENGLRMILNYGHTIGHAFEHLSNFRLKHGEAISIGMIKENQLSKLSEKEKIRIQNLLIYFDLPVQNKLSSQDKELIKLIKNDKKVKQKLPLFAIPSKIGKTEIREFKEKEILKAIK